MPGRADISRGLIPGDISVRLHRGERPEAIITLLRTRIDDLEALVEDLTAPPPGWLDIPARLGLHLTVAEAACLGALLRAAPRVVRRESLLSVMSRAPGSTGEADAKVVDVIICRLRRKLPRARETVRIITAWGVGYRVETQVGPS